MYFKNLNNPNEAIYNLSPTLHLSLLLFKIFRNHNSKRFGLRSPLHNRQRSQDKKITKRVFPNATVNFPKHLEHTRKKQNGVAIGHPTITTREKI